MPAADSAMHDESPARRFWHRDHARALAPPARRAALAARLL